MNDTNIFLQQSLDFQFLSVCHYINTFGIIFYNRDLITFEERNQSILVINTLFDYINKSKNEFEAKLQILQTALRGSDLYGGGDNQTLDMKYVEETYQYIINEALFSHYGNINGYLAKVINQADNMNYFALKENVLYNLRENYNAKDYCSVSNQNTKLTPLTIRKVFEDHIWSTFPQPEQDMSIIDVNYIYAMVGLKIVTSVTTDVNLTFQEYILISREIDLQHFNKETYQMVVKMFSTPALFFYAFKMKGKFRNMDQFTLNDDFWSEAYENLFLHISTSVNEIVTQGIESSLHFKLDKEMKNLKSRTLVAYTRLQLSCQYENIAQVSEIHVAVYKTFFHWITKLLLPDRCRTSELPELEQVYEDQFAEVEKLYKEIEIIAVEKALEDGQLLEKVNPNATVLFGRVPDYPQRCNLCSPTPRKKNNDIYLLFAIKQETETDYFAFRQENNSLTLVSSRGNEPEFGKTVANVSFLRMEIAQFSQTLKFLGEDYKMFVERVAEMKTKQFIKGIKRYYYDETLGEKYLNFVKSLIPFYNCVDSAKSGDVAGAALSCTIDLVSLIPLAGFSAKYVTQVGSIFAREIGHRYLITNTLARAGIVTNLPITTALREITTTAVRTIANEILTRGFLKDFAVATFRSVDPGFELFYKVSNFGLKTFRKLFRNIISHFRSIPKFSNTLLIIRSIFRDLKRNMNLIPDETGLVPVVLAERNIYTMVRYLYPGGLNHFGPTCITSYGRTAELRSIEGYPFEIPVMPEKSGSVTFYKQYIPETGKISNVKLQMGDNDILRRVGYILDKMFADGHDVNLFRSYDVYYNTVHWKKALLDRPATEDVNQPVHRPNSPVHPELPHYSGNAREHLTEHHPRSDPQFGESSGNSAIYYPPFFNQDFQITLRGNVAGNLGSNFPPMTSIEFSGTLRGSVVEPNLQSPENDLAESRKVNSQGDNSNVLQTLKDFVVSRQSGNHVVEPTLGSSENELAESWKGNSQSDNSNVLQTLRDFVVSRQSGSQISRSSSEVGNPIFSHFLESKPKVAVKSPDGEEYQFSRNTDPGFIKDNVFSTAEDSTIPKKIRKLDSSDISKIPVHYISKVPELDELPGTSRQLVTHPDENFYRVTLREPTYTRYLEILTMLKKNGLQFVKQDTVKINFLRTALNKLALFQLEAVVPLKKPVDLWCTSIITGQRNIDFLRSLKGNYFFFNDITLLTNRPPGPSASKTLDRFSMETEVRYHLKIDSSNGILDLRQFHYNFRDNFVVFNELIFTVTDTYFIGNKNILIVELKSRGVSRGIWQYFRNQDISHLLEEGRALESLRMRRITDAACFMSDNAPLCTFRSSRNFLKNFILSRKDSYTNRVPTYSMFASDFKDMKFRYSYENWKIKSHRFIEDVIFNYYLDEITELTEAERRIEDLYSVYFQVIQEAFENYRKIRKVSRYLRFEDYYVLYSYAKDKLLTSQDGVRRLEAAVNRLSLRQCEVDVTTPTTLYRGEMFNRKLAADLQSLEKKVIVFDQIQMFSPQKNVEMVSILNRAGGSSEIPVLMEVTLNNQAGTADIGRVLKDGSEFHVVTADFEFTLDKVIRKEIEGQELLVLKMHDFESPTETRMVRMAKKLDELFSTETKFYLK